MQLIEPQHWQLHIAKIKSIEGVIAVKATEFDSILVPIAFKESLFSC